MIGQHWEDESLNFSEALQSVESGSPKCGPVLRHPIEVALFDLRFETADIAAPSITLTPSVTK